MIAHESRSLGRQVLERCASYWYTDLGLMNVSRKSYTGVELLRVLVQNGAGPILLISFTNHALDHLLCSVLDAHITQKIVRLGSRSADERIAKFSIEAVEQVAGKSRLDRAFAGQFKELKQTEEEIKEFMKTSLHLKVDSPTILRYLEVEAPEYYQGFLDLPPWINFLYEVDRSSSSAGEDSWTRVGKDGRDQESDGTTYAYWLSCGDIDFLEGMQTGSSVADGTGKQGSSTIPAAQPASSNPFQVLQEVEEDVQMETPNSPVLDAVDDDVSVSDDEIAPEEAWMLVDDPSTNVPSGASSDPQEPPNSVSQSEIPQEARQDLGSRDNGAQPPSSSSHRRALQPSDFLNIYDFFGYFGYSRIPLRPTADRPLSTLREIEDVWTLSRSERARLHTFWTERVRFEGQESIAREFERLRQRHADALEHYNEGKAEVRLHCGLLASANTHMT